MNLKIIFLLFIKMNFVYNCKVSDSIPEGDTSYVSGEYENIFKNIPYLFEYVMGIIEEKPEILEKDDVTVFTEGVRKVYHGSDEDDDDIKSLQSDEDEQVHIEFHKNGDSDEGKNKKIKVSNVENSKSDEDFYGKNDVKDSKDNFDSDQDSSEEGDIDNSSEEFKGSGEDEDDRDEIDPDLNWYRYSAAIGKSRWNLSPEEIAEKTLETEKLLEEYNVKKS